GGGCRAPIGALGVVTGERLELRGGHARNDSGPAFLARSGGIDEATDLGRRLAADLGILDGAAGRGSASQRRPRGLVARAGNQADALLRALESADIEAVPVPAIQIDLVSCRASVDRAAGLLHVVDWVVVTSPNGARAILEAAERVLTELGVPRWAAVGPATRA